MFAHFRKPCQFQEIKKHCSSYTCYMYVFFCFFFIAVDNVVALINFSRNWCKVFFVAFNNFFGLKLKEYNFQALEVVDRGSETQPQVAENLNNLT